MNCYQKARLGLLTSYKINAIVVNIILIKIYNFDIISLNLTEKEGSMRDRLHKGTLDKATLVHSKQNKKIVITALGSKIEIIKDIIMPPFIKQTKSYRGLGRIQASVFRVRSRKNVVLDPKISEYGSVMILNISCEGVSIPIICNGRFCIEVTPSNKTAPIEHFDVVFSQNVPCILDLAEETSGQIVPRQEKEPL